MISNFLRISKLSTGLVKSVLIAQAMFSFNWTLRDNATVTNFQNHNGKQKSIFKIH